MTETGSDLPSYVVSQFITMNEDKDNEIKKSVLGAIQSGKVTMKPRWHFVLIAALAATGIVILALVLVYLVSFILFALRQSGVLFVPAFGLRGWFALLRSLPWILIIAVAAFVVLLEILVRRYAFAYREPLLYSVVGIVVAVIAGGLIIFQTPLHRMLFDSARKNQLPLMGAFYRGYGGERVSDVHPGQIVATTTDGFILAEPFQTGTEAIYVASDTDVPPGTVFVPGETVVIFGERSGTVIDAIGVRQIPGGLDFQSPPPGQ